MPMDLATMPPSSTEIADLVERLRNGRCVLCAGSRLTAADGERSFRTLVGKLLAELPAGDDADGARRVLDSRPLAAAGFVRRRLGDRFAEELRKAAAPFAELPEAIRLLGELPFRAIVTTAYDDAFERAFTKDGVMPRIYTPRDAEALKNDGKLRFVFKALGDPTRADSIVWSAEDLQTALADGGYRTVAHDLYRSRSFLFVGFDGPDPDLGDAARARARRRARGRRRALRGHAGARRRRKRGALRGLSHPRLVVGERGRAGASAQGRDRRPGRPGAARRRRLRRLAGAHLRGAGTRRAAEPRDNRRSPRCAVGQAARARRLGEAGRPEARARRRRADAPSVAPSCCSTSPSIFEHEVGDLSKAFTALVAGYKEHPRVEAWTELERLAAGDGDVERAALRAG